jgi:2-hydroxy-3-oxopropionate reductase
VTALGALAARPTRRPVPFGEGAATGATLRCHVPRARGDAVGDPTRRARRSRVDAHDDARHRTGWSAGPLVSAADASSAEQDLPAVGFIGVGVMGRPMAQNLLAAGHPLTVFTRTKARAEPVLDGGAQWAGNARAVADASDVVITMLPDSRDVAAVAEGDDGILAGARRGLTWIDASSIAPSVAVSLAHDATVRGMECLDAPVSGGERGAVEATLSIMVGGPRPTFDRCLPILERLGSTVVLVGDAGAGQVTKLCNQIVVGTTIAAVAEALVLAGKSGVDPARVREVLLGGFAQSRVLDAHGQRMLQHQFEPGFRAVLHQKDLTNALDAARDAASPVPLSSLTLQLLTAQIANGGGDLDHAALAQVYEMLARYSLS